MNTTFRRTLNVLIGFVISAQPLKKMLQSFVNSTTGFVILYMTFLSHCSNLFILNL